MVFPFYGDTSYIALYKIGDLSTHIYYIKVLVQDSQEIKLLSAYSNDIIFSIDSQTKIQYNISPNPFSDRLKIQGDFQIVEIFSSTGALVYSREHIENESNLNLSYLKKGLYFIRLSTENGEVLKKIIKN